MKNITITQNNMKKHKKYWKCSSRDREVGRGRGRAQTRYLNLKTWTGSKLRTIPTLTALHYYSPQNLFGSHIIVRLVMPLASGYSFYFFTCTSDKISERETLHFSVMIYLMISGFEIHLIDSENLWKAINQPNRCETLCLTPEYSNSRLHFITNLFDFAWKAISYFRDIFHVSNSCSFAKALFWVFSLVLIKQYREILSVVRITSTLRARGTSSGFSRMPQTPSWANMRRINVL